ncbi:hypothetical protein NXS19_001500 [Fusarium pseudograminearum]|nr:hypothetical protein NXS19_001500 [Fusarium pseudograminearum]
MVMATPGATSGFDALPSEVIAHIASFTPTDDLKALSCTSKFVRCAVMPWVFRSVKIHGEAFDRMTERLKLFCKFFGHKMAEKLTSLVLEYKNK